MHVDGSSVIVHVNAGADAFCVVPGYGASFEYRIGIRSGRSIYIDCPVAGF